MTESAPLVRVMDLYKRYGDLEVLRGLNAEVQMGEKVAIIGPSGSGKSTLLRLLMTLERHDGGTIEIDGERLWAMEANGRWVPADKAHLRRVRGKTGMVFQHFNLFPHMTALRNVTLAPTLNLGLSKDEAERRARELLEMVGLADKIDTYPAQLSGGQKQRVAIARALAMQPKLMLFDEVTSALDPELVGEVLAVLRELAHRSDMTMMIVTHEMRFAQEIADRVLFFDRGVVLEEAPPEVMFSEPAHDRTRQFLRSVLESR